MNTRAILIFLSSCLAISAGETPPDTQRLMLSGHGPSDAVEWDFRISDGRRAGEQAKIPVPSQWEQHGFGNYDYGSVPAKDKHKEDGFYQRGFSVPEEWRGMQVRIVFEGSMTDTTVVVNGKEAGPTHQGGFYRFHYDITDKVVFGGENRLEVTVSKDSSNPTVEAAERDADFWVFGGIYRPVWLEARPTQSIEWTSIDAKGDGLFRARVHLEGSGPADKVVARVTDTQGRSLGKPLSSNVANAAPVELSGKFEGVAPWSAENPNLYRVEFALMRGEKVIHQSSERFGFRTLETRPGQGVFVNGRRITVKGVNRHCFRPKSGRALDPQDSIDDVRLIKSMNMNAVRCSHYPPDKAFLDACDELGLYVENEICTWQKPALDTPTARRVIGQMIRRDVNHPSILWWANGNEGGWNTEVDGDFAIWDIQKRPVLHPWEEFSGYQTKHYPVWERLQQDLADKYLVMPTEYLHGLYDGGHGAGLEDYWNAITSRPNGVGGFLWVLADEGISRTDRGGEIDNWGTNAPDGIVGPNHEKEASYLTAKDIFCPVQIDLKEIPADFDGNLEVRNTYDFRDLTTVRFEWSLGDPPASEGSMSGPLVPAGGKGVLKLSLPGNWRESGILQLRAVDADGQELWKWGWPLNAAGPSEGLTNEKLRVEEGASILIKAGGVSYEFDSGTGHLKRVDAGSGPIGLCHGPRLVGIEEGAEFPLDACKVKKVSASGFEASNRPELATDGRLETRWSQQGKESWLLIELEESTIVDAVAIAWQHAATRSAAFAIEVSNDGVDWSEVRRGSCSMGRALDLTEFNSRQVKFLRLRGLGNDRNDWNSVLEIRIGKRKAAAKVSVTGKPTEYGAYRIESKGNGAFKSFAWTVHQDGSVDLDYCYEVKNPCVFHGITFDFAEKGIDHLSWSGRGPERVWANRMRGTWFGSFGRDFKKLRPGIDYGDPHTAGFYADVRNADVKTSSGTIRVTNHQKDTFLRVGTNDEGEKITVEWPAGGFSLMHAIPAIGNKFHQPSQIGPQSSLHPAAGLVRGKATFRFTP